MTEFEVYLSVGFEHIFNIAAYDHVLFIATLVAAYPLASWKRMILILTAFTIGHSITLALSALNILSLNITVIEVLIAFTILIAASYNLTLQRNAIPVTRMYMHYTIATGFGLIHGVGFASQFRALLGSGSEVFTALLAFNLGVELGQIVIFSILLSILLLLTRLFRIRHQALCIGISLLAAVIAFALIIQRMQNLL